jgi:hypothetical protein
VVTFQIEPSGEVSSASADGEGQVVDCLLALVRGLKFPKHLQRGAPIHFPFKLGR